MNENWKLETNMASKRTQKYWKRTALIEDVIKAINRMEEEESLTIIRLRETAEAEAIWKEFEPGQILDVYSIGEVKLVAVEGTANDWAAYIGRNDVTNEAIASQGTKLTEKQARAFFTQKYLEHYTYRE